MMKWREKVITWYKYLLHWPFSKGVRFGLSRKGDSVCFPLRSNSVAFAMRALSDFIGTVAGERGTPLAKWNGKGIIISSVATLRCKAVL